MRRTGFGIPVLLLFIAGCGEGGKRGAEVTHFPRWDFERYQRIAVLPVQTRDPRARRDADAMTAQLTDLLANNGAFTVVSRADMKAVLTEQDLSRLADVADPRTALPEGQVMGVQALVIGTLSNYDLIADRQQVRQPVFATDAYGRPVIGPDGRRVVIGEQVVEAFRCGAAVGGNVRVIDAATGQLLLSYNPPQLIQPPLQESFGQPPPVAPEDVAAQAARDLAYDFYVNIAPTRIPVKLNKDMLIVATDYYDGRYETTEKLSAALPEFMVVVRGLPPSCNRNPFHVAIAAKDGRQNLFEQDFLWSDSLGQRGMQCPVPMTALNASGEAHFEAKLYSVGDERPILTRKFKVEAPKKEKKRKKEENEG